MDNLTHSLFALTLANAGLRRAGRGVTPALLIASNIPDLEILTTFTGGRVAYLAAHRGPTHGPGGLLLAVGTAAAVWGVQRLCRARGRSAPRGEDARPDASFPSLLAVAVIGVLGHIGMDFATSYGTRIFSPFTAAWFGVDWMPIVDAFLLAAFVAGIVATRWRPRWRVPIAAAVLLLATGDYAFRAATHSVALDRAIELETAERAAQRATGAAPLAVPAPARPATVFHYLGRSRPADLPAALPTLGSPFRWRLVVPDRGGYLVAEVDLREHGPGWAAAARSNAVWFPNDTGPLIEKAAAARLGAVFLAFSRFPAAEIVTHSNGDLTVHWYDLRFAARRVPMGNDRRQHTSPFGAWVRLSAAGSVLAQGLGPG